MLVKIYSVYDSKTEAYLQPFFVASRGGAVRSFAEAVNDKSHSFGKYPQDFILFELGTFEDSSAEIDLYDAPISIGVGSEFVQSVN